MTCKECSLEIGQNNKSGLCQFHMRRLNALNYYRNLRKEHICLRCRAPIIPVMIKDVLKYRQVCENCTIKHKNDRLKRKPEDIIKSAEYHKAYLQRPEIKEMRRIYQARYRKKQDEKRIESQTGQEEQEVRKGI